eukprot:11760426-Heterocapsa_arctica.AAC.1
MESALRTAGFVRDPYSNKWSVLDPIDLEDTEAEDEWEVVEGFPEVPAGGLRAELWTPKNWGT